MKSITSIGILFIIFAISFDRAAESQPLCRRPMTPYEIYVSKIVQHRMVALARRNREHGSTVLRFTIDRSGQVAESHISLSSGSTAVDILALRSVPIGYRFPPLPDDVTTQSLTLVIPLRF